MKAVTIRLVATVRKVDAAEYLVRMIDGASSPRYETMKKKTRPNFSSVYPLHGLKRKEDGPKEVMDVIVGKIITHQYSVQTT